MKIKKLITFVALLTLPFSSFGDEFSLRIPSAPITLDWNLAHTSSETYFLMNLMEGLVEMNSALHVKPALAEKWEVSNGGKTYTFILKKDRKWSDGHPVKASQFKDSWLRLIDPKTKSPYANFLFDIQGAEEFHTGKLKNKNKIGIEVEGNHKLIVTLRKPLSFFPMLLSFWVTFPIRTDLIKKHGKNWTHPKNLVTLGPYLLSPESSSKQFLLVKNPNYPSSEYPDKTTIWIEPSNAKAKTLFETKKTDVLLSTTTKDLLNLKRTFKIQQFPYLATYYLSFNIDQEPFNRVLFRKAIALSISQNKIPALLQSGQIEAKSFLPPGIPGHNKETRLKGSLFEARKALAQSGASEKSLQKKFKLYISSFDGAENLGNFIAQSLREKLNINVSVVVDSTKNFKDALKKGKADLFIKHWGGDYPDPSNFLEVFHTKSGSNPTSWKNSKYDQWIDTAKSLSNPSARLKLYKKAETFLVGNQAVLVPLFYKKRTVLLGERVTSFDLNPLNYLFLKNVRLKK